MTQLMQFLGLAPDIHWHLRKTRGAIIPALGRDWKAPCAAVRMAYFRSRKVSQDGCSRIAIRP